MTPSEPSTADQVLDAALALREDLSGLTFAEPVSVVLNPLDYAWAPHEAYVRRYATGPRSIVLLGMNPGPFGMMQTGVPFGEVASVRDWMGIEAPVGSPAQGHPKRPIQGFACQRSEVSGRRLWHWAALHWGSAQAFFAECFVINYCPLVWLEATGRNRTPVQLPVAERAPVEAACDHHLARVLEVLQPQWAIGVGGFAQQRLQALAQGPLLASPLARSLKIGQILHPSPASPAANRGWDEAVQAQWRAMGLTQPLSD